MNLNIENLPTRKEIPLLLNQMGLNGIGVELGVAKGAYSNVLLERSNLTTLYGIDAWNSRRHTKKEYLKVKSKAKKWKGRFVIIRKKFSEVVDNFEEEYFDFIFIDGFARKGQQHGKTMDEWWPKLKKGGLLAIHDYTPAFPENVKQIRRWARKMQIKGYKTHNESKKTWMAIK